jgi:sugar/nucleoside kinase (ribokinase family)
LPGELSAACRHWHIASYFLLRRLRSFWVQWAQRCKEAGVTLSLDTNWDPENRWEGVTELLPFIDVVLPNENEALALTGETDILKAARRLAAQGSLVVVKLGKKGAIAVRGDKVYELHATEVESGPVMVADSVGAGDNFDAGFLRAWLLGRSISECLSLAHRCAVASLAKPGGIEGQLRELVR